MNDESQADKIARFLFEKRQKLAETQHIPVEDLHHLVYSAYCLGTISSGKATEILRVFLTDFEKGFAHWLEQESEWCPELKAEYEQRQQRDWQSYFEED